MIELDRATAVTGLLVFFLVGTVGMLGATIDSVQGANQTSPEFSMEREIGEVSPSNVSGDDGGSQEGEIRGDSQSLSLSACIQFMRTPPVILGIVVSVAGLLYGAYRRYNIAASLIFGTVLIPIVWVGYFLSTNCAGGSGGGGDGVSIGTGMVTNEGGPSAPPLPPELVAGIFGVVMIGGVALLFTMTGEEESLGPTEEEDPEPETAAFAEAAGRAADRIEEANVPVDNAVYEAWLEMTSLLRIENPRSTAPRDFTDAAVQAGLDRDDVEELTQLFNEVRYGDKRADTREDRALEILRNIEYTYRESEPDTSGSGVPGPDGRPADERGER